MKTIKEWISKIEIRAILKPMLAVGLLGFVYNYAYMCLMQFQVLIPTWGYYALQAILSLLSAIGFYWICTYVWVQKPKKISFQEIGWVLAWQVCVFAIVSLGLNVLYTMAIAQTETILMIVVQLLSAVGMIFIIPLQLLFYYALFSNKKGKEIFSYMGSVFVQKQKTILNWFCALIMFVVVIDTFTNGFFGLLTGFNAYSLLTGIIYLGNPMFQWMMTMFVGVSSDAALSQVTMISFQFFLIGVMYCIFELNYVRFIQRKCYEYES